jgi:hypothetical protein
MAALGHMRQLPPWSGPPQATPILDTTLGPVGLLGASQAPAAGGA